MGIKDLDTLIGGMNPVLEEDEFVFVTIKEEDLPTFLTKSKLVYREREGITLVLEKQVAESMKINYDSTWAEITLDIHSDLETVGFMAKITEVLAREGISANIVSAFYHDHIFVQFGLRQKAYHCLQKLSGTATRTEL